MAWGYLSKLRESGEPSNVRSTMQQTQSEHRWTNRPTSSFKGANDFTGDGGTRSRKKTPSFKSHRRQLSDEEF
jgi:hypothetical protein